LAWLFVFLVVAPGATAQSKKHLAWSTEADTLYNQGDYLGAAALYTKVLDANPPRNGKYTNRGFYSVLYNRAVCYYFIEQYGKALADIAVFEPQFPKSAQPKVLKAYIYRALDDQDKQLENVEAAMALQPPKAEFLKWRGMLMLQKDKYDEARADLFAARSMDDDPETESYLGLLYRQTGHPDSAYICFNKAIELSPTFISVYLYAGSAALQDGNYVLSLEYLDLALRIESKHADALFYKGVVLIEMKQMEDGCRCLNRAFYAGSDDAGDYLAQYCFGSGN